VSAKRLGNFKTCVYTVAPLQGEGWGGVVQGATMRYTYFLKQISKMRIAGEKLKRLQFPQLGFCSNSTFRPLDFIGFISKATLIAII
jgi:hypothetical protein